MNLLDEIRPGAVQVAFAWVPVYVVYRRYLRACKQLDDALAGKDQTNGHNQILSVGATLVVLIRLVSAVVILTARLGSTNESGWHRGGVSGSRGNRGPQFLKASCRLSIFMATRLWDLSPYAHPARRIRTSGSSGTLTFVGVSIPQAFGTAGNHGNGLNPAAARPLMILLLPSSLMPALSFGSG